MNSKGEYMLCDQINSLAARMQMNEMFKYFYFFTISKRLFILFTDKFIALGDRPMGALECNRHLQDEHLNISTLRPTHFLPR